MQANANHPRRQRRRNVGWSANVAIKGDDRIVGVWQVFATKGNPKNSFELHRAWSFAPGLIDLHTHRDKCDREDKDPNLRTDYLTCRASRPIVTGNCGLARTTGRGRVFTGDGEARGIRPRTSFIRSPQMGVRTM